MRIPPNTYPFSWVDLEYTLDEVPSRRPRQMSMIDRLERRNRPNLLSILYRQNGYTPSEVLDNSMGIDLDPYVEEGQNPTS